VPNEKKEVINRPQETEEPPSIPKNSDDEYAKIKEKVRQDYPNDYITQKGVYDMAVKAYEYMKTVPDDEIKAKVKSDYPDDYISQKGVYEMAVKAYQYMRTVPDDEIKAKVRSDYPGDYVTQKGVYEMSIKAKNDMK